MPKVQEILKAANEDRELGKGLNGDEANALGAAFEVGRGRCRRLLEKCKGHSQEQNFAFSKKYMPLTYPFLCFLKINTQGCLTQQGFPSEEIHQPRLQPLPN